MVSSMVGMLNKMFIYIKMADNIQFGLKLYLKK